MGFYAFRSEIPKGVGVSLEIVLWDTLYVHATSRIGSLASNRLIASRL